MEAVSILLIVVLVLIAVALFKAVALIPQGEAAVIERLGRYTRTVSGGLTIMIPFVDRVRDRVDTREQVVSFPPQAVITKDNLTVAIDIVVTFQVNDAARAIYGVMDYIIGVEQISVATLRDVVGGMTLEETLTSRDVINRRLRGELDAATSKWGLRISRVELKAIDPPPSIQQSMEMQMKADREKRAMILTAEGQRESDIKTAEGEKQARILGAEGDKHAQILSAEADRQARMLRAEGDRAATYLEAQGQAKAIQKVTAAIKSSEVTPEVLSYQYLEKLPEMAQGDANKVWMLPMQFGDSLEQFAKAFANKDDDGTFRYEPTPADDSFRDLANETTSEDWFSTESAPEIAKAVAEANAVANKSVDEQPDDAPLTPQTPTDSSAATGSSAATAEVTDGSESEEETPSWPAYGQSAANPPARPANPQQPGAET
ncbi:MAG: SPFH domain-containing protein [Mycobacteriaceae bacterium]